MSLKNTPYDRIGKLIIEIDEANGQVTELQQTADILAPSLTR
jgi:hypothetical protein